MDLSQLIIQAAKWIVGTGMGIYGTLEAIKIYNKRKEVEAVEKSVGAEALKKKNEEIKNLEARIEKLENVIHEMNYRNDSIRDICERLETTYTSLMNRLTDGLLKSRL